jgi:hypothetical protein
MLQIMHEISTAEAAELFDVTRKTIALWAQHGVMVKLRHGVFDLKKSLKNWAEYQRCIFQGADNPLELWEIRRDIAWSEAHPLPPYDPESVELVDIDELVPQRVTVERDAAGRITRVIGEVLAKGGPPQGEA